MLTDTDLMNVQVACERMSKPVTIFAYAPGTNSLFESNLLNIARQVSGVSQEKIGIEESGEPVLPGKPSLTLSDGRLRNIHYLAAPEGKEFGPFLEALSWLGGDETGLGVAALEPLKQLSRPVHLTVLMTEACPHCPSTIRSVLSLAVGSPLVTVSVADVLWFEDVGQRYKVKSTPTVIVNDGLTLVGQVSAQDLARKLVEAETGSLTSVIESMMDSGRAEDAAELLCREGRPEAILPLYLSQEFSTRMAALVVMQDALERNPRALDPILTRLTDLLFVEDVGLRGDTAELLGRAGNPDATPALEKAAQDPDPDVREAAQEALELLGASRLRQREVKLI